MPSQQNDTLASLRRHTLSVATVAALLIAGVGTLLVATKISGAVIASGSVVVQSSVKKVRHPAGGVVQTLYVREGAHVGAGQVLLQLDGTAPRATRDMIVKQIWELKSRRARLEAERDGLSAPRFPPAVDGLDGDYDRIRNGEARLFEMRRDARNGQRQQMQERIGQLEAEIRGLSEQNAAKDTELAVITKELEGVQQLYDRNLVQLPRLDGLRRDVARVEGERGQIAAAIAQTKGKIAETRLQILQVDVDLRSDVSKELADIEGKLGEMEERRLVAEDQLNHLEIRAPDSGYVQELSPHATGAVISPGSDILTLVPDNDDLVVAVKVRSQDIDKVSVGQHTMLRFLNFDQRSTPDVDGSVTLVSPDVGRDGKGDAAFYDVQIAVHGQAAFASRLRPGMPVDAFILTEDRTILAYLLKPFNDQMSRAFR